MLKYTLQIGCNSIFLKIIHIQGFFQIKSKLLSAFLRQSLRFNPLHVQELY